jgi:putative hydrolase of the HAD superfamily
MNTSTKQLNGSSSAPVAASLQDEAEQSARLRNAVLARRPHLVLDIGGVLLSNLSPLFWQLVAEAAEVDHATLYNRYKRDISPSLWRGLIDEEQFWDWLLEQAPKVGTPEARTFLSRSLNPLPAMERLPQWSQVAEVHILSNHLLAWVMPLLMPVQACLTHIVVSSSTGWRKPQSELFAHLDGLLPRAAPVLFVDDQLPNLRQAETFGWDVALADPDGRWIETVDGWLSPLTSVDEGHRL